MLRKLKLLFATLLLVVGLASGQSVSGAGNQPTDTTQGNVNLNNLNIHLDVPLAPGATIHYNSNMWQNNGNSSTWAISNTYTNANYPWGLNNTVAYFPPVMGYMYPTPLFCGGSSIVAYQYTNWVDGGGNTHPYTSVTLSAAGGTVGSCTGTVTSSTFVLTDGSGVTVNLSSSSPNTIVDSAGNITTFGGNGYFVNPAGNEGVAISQTDPNGNSTTLTLSNNFETATLKTPLGAAVTLNGPIGCGNGTYTYPSSLGSQVTSITCTPYTLQTVFGCSGITDYNGNIPIGEHIPPQYPSPIWLVTKVTLADSSSYRFTYESQAAPGATGLPTSTARIASITYPNGGTTTYAYTGANNGINCSDGTALGLTAANLDGTWTYTRNVGAGTTTVVSPSPASNTTVYTFSKQSASPNASFITQVQYKQGNGTVLLTKAVCYNGNTTSCATATAPTFPLTEVDTYFTPNGVASSNRQKIVYDCASTSPCYQNVVEVDSYDFGASTATSKAKYTSFGKSWNGSTCVSIGSGINNVPCSATMLDGSNNELRAALFSYDSNGKLTATQVATALSGTTFTSSLTASATYNSNGTTSTATDFAGNVTTYTYGSSCHGYLPSKITPAISTLESKFTYDTACLGLQATSTDPNGAVETSAYSDPFNRISSIADPSGYVTYFGYTPTNPISQNVSFSNGSTNINVYSILDVLGRPSLSQQRNPAGTWNTVQFGYSWDSNGRTSTVSTPCAAALQSGCSTAVTTGTSDALGRPLVTTDGGGGTLTFAYSGSSSCTAGTSYCQIVQFTLGPAPTGEVVKQAAKEYNGLGQLIASCNISSASTSKSCGFGGLTGFPTVYSYNADGTLASVAASSTAATQTHSFTYDNIGRTLSEVYPESGETDYVYDVSSNCDGTPENGLLLEKDDANGNLTCYYYDSLNRLTAVRSSGPNFDGKYKTFVWDTATVNGVAMTNAKGKIAEAYTSNVASGTKVVDEGFSYTIRGQVSDVYEKTPNSGEYYHTTASYFPVGALNVLSMTGYNTWTYTVDSMGRPNGMTQTSGSSSTSVVKSTDYNVFSEVADVNYGNGDTDSYSYDPNTGRMSSFSFTVNGKTVGNSLTWNANGTLRQMQTVDAINPANNQICDYGTDFITGYDEQARLLRVTCNNGATPVWAQDFSYDAFGNLTKTALGGYPGTAWNPGYNETNNQYTLSGTKYDANGNVIKDTLHTYSWNQDNLPLTASGGTSSPIAYDAFNNRAEQYYGSTYKQYLMSPAGLLGLMSKTAVSSLRVPASTSTYDPVANNTWHQDWQGSTRLISGLASRASVSDRAFAPYGEVYNNVGSTTYPNFTGDNQDLLSGVYDTPFRELDSTQGRWVSVDPAHASWSGYAYSSNPLGETDPSGLDGEGGVPTPPPGDLCIDCNNSGAASGTTIFDYQQQYSSFALPAGGLSYNTGLNGGYVADNPFSPLAIPDASGAQATGETYANGGSFGSYASAEDLMADFLNAIVPAGIQQQMGSATSDDIQFITALGVPGGGPINNPAPGGTGMAGVSASARAAIRAANRAAFSVTQSLQGGSEASTGFSLNEAMQTYYDRSGELAFDPQVQASMRSWAAARMNTAWTGGGNVGGGGEVNPAELLSFMAKSYQGSSELTIGTEPASITNIFRIVESRFPTWESPTFTVVPIQP